MDRLNYPQEPETIGGHAMHGGAPEVDFIPEVTVTPRHKFQRLHLWNMERISRKTAQKKWFI